MCVGLEHVLHLVLSENADTSFHNSVMHVGAVGCASTVNRLKEVLVR